MKPLFLRGAHVREGWLIGHNFLKMIFLDNKRKRPRKKNKSTCIAPSFFQFWLDMFIIVCKYVYIVYKYILIFTNDIILSIWEFPPQKCNCLFHRLDSNLFARGYARLCQVRWKRDGCQGGSFVWGDTFLRLNKSIAKPTVWSKNPEILLMILNKTINPSSGVKMAFLKATDDIFWIWPLKM